MAVTRRPNVISHTASGDSSTGRIKVWALLWNGSTDAAHDLEIKNGDGTVILKLKAGANTGHLILYWPFGPHVFVDGLETDTIDSGSVEYILA